MAGLPEGGTWSQADEPGHSCVTDVPLGAGGPQTPVAGRALCQAPGLGQAWTLVVTPSPLQCDSGCFTCLLWDLGGSQAGKWLWLMAPLPTRRENGHSRAGAHAGVAAASVLCLPTRHRSSSSCRVSGARHPLLRNPALPNPQGLMNSSCW